MAKSAIYFVKNIEPLFTRENIFPQKGETKAMYIKRIRTLLRVYREWENFLIDKDPIIGGLVWCLRTAKKRDTVVLEGRIIKGCDTKGLYNVYLDPDDWGHVAEKIEKIKEYHPTREEKILEGYWKTDKVEVVIETDNYILYKKRDDFYQDMRYQGTRQYLFLRIN